MIKGEFSYTLEKNEVSGEQFAEIVAASTALVDEQAAQAEAGLEGLDAFLAPKYGFDTNGGETWFGLGMGVERRDGEYKDVEAELQFLKRSLIGRLSTKSGRVLEDENNFGGEWIVGMNTYNLTHIESNHSNAVALQTLSLQDLRAGGHRSPLDLANPYSLAKLAMQKERLERAPQDYVGVFRGDSMVAFIKTHEWLLGDQIDFGKRAVRRANRKSYNKGVQTFPDSPLGIFGLVADKEAAHYQDRQRMIDDLLAYALFIARTGAEKPRRTLVPIHDHDEVAPALIRAGFEPLHLEGKSYGMHQQLFEHPAAA